MWAVQHDSLVSHVYGANIPIILMGRGNHDLPIFAEELPDAAPTFEVPAEQRVPQDIRVHHPPKDMLEHFADRQVEMHRLLKELDDGPLHTLHGRPGVGKSALMAAVLLLRVSHALTGRPYNFCFFAGLLLNTHKVCRTCVMCMYVCFCMPAGCA
jgi:hypothetical protein